VNDAPAGTDKTITMLEDGSRTMTAADFGFRVGRAHPGNPVTKPPRIPLSPGDTLKLNCVAVTHNQSASLAHIHPGLLVFAPAANEVGTSYASSGLKVHADGVIASTGRDPNPALFPYTTLFRSVNDAPAGTDKTITMLEDGSRTMTAADFGFSDANDTPANALANVIITSLATDGTLKLNGVAVTLNQSVSVADINSGLLVFAPDANENGTSYASFGFKVQDDGGTANAVVDTDAGANTITSNVTSVNDAPAGTDKTITMLEDGSRTMTAADFGFSDANDNPANALANVLITSLATDGTLKLNGVAVTLFPYATLFRSNSGLLVFAPDANENGTSYASFGFKVQDDGGTANAGVDTDPVANTITFNVTSVNNPPVANPDTNSGDAVTESGVNPGNTAFPGDASATGNVLTTD